MTIQNAAQGISVTENDFVITRIFEAPKTLVYKAWSDPALMKEWWGPHHFTTPSCEIDLKVGGTYRFVMRSPEGIDYPTGGVYKEIVESERLVFTMNCNEHTKEWHDLLNKNRPNRKGDLHEFVVTVTFEEEHGKTKLTIAKHFDSAEDRNAMVNLGMSEGWNQSLEKLETLLARQ